MISSEAKKILIAISLIFLIGFNFWLYRSEFKVLVDPNDNIFQYALVDEAKTIWKNIFAGKLSPFYLLDSWNERWAEGFALSSYYAHIPQAVLGFFGGFKFFVVVRTLMIILLPLMFYWGGVILGLPLLFNLILALFSQAIFTNGLYGIDLSSFVWRGWGLSAQLMAVFFMPVAFAYTIDYFEHKRNLGKAILFNFLVAQCHFGMFSLMLLGYPLYLISLVISTERNVWRNLFTGGVKGIPRLLESPLGMTVKRIVLFTVLTLFSLSYFIVPFFLQSQYRNFSVWDPIWKFDSWGAKQSIIWFLNGDLFDFNRLPIITICVLLGLFVGLAEKRKIFNYLSILFTIFMVLFFGRTSLGKLIDIIPGFSEFHLHRIIVMVQFVGLFLGAWFLYRVFIVIPNLFPDLTQSFWLVQNRFWSRSAPQNDEKKDRTFQQNKLVHILKIGIFVFLILLLIIYLEKPLIAYMKDNATWIERSNKAYQMDLSAYEKVKAKLNSVPRTQVYVGKPGNWGRNFTVGEVPLYMNLSRDGYPVIGFLPESWSPNSDPEQFFDENKKEFYDLYNVGFSVLPDNIKPPHFAKLVLKEGKYALYKIDTGGSAQRTDRQAQLGGWFDAGATHIAVKGKKTDLLNVTRLWFGSKLFTEKEYPMIDLSKNAPDGKKWYIEMTDLNNFINLNDGVKRSIWASNLFGGSITALPESNKSSEIQINDQTVLPDEYKAQLEVKSDCQNCIVVLKQSFHPNWQVTMNGEKVPTFAVFPFYIGFPLEKKGSYTVVAVYKPNRLKIILVIGEVVVFIGLIVMGRRLLEKRFWGVEV